MSWYTRPQDSSLTSCKHYLSIINTARTCFCFSLRSTDTHYPSQSSWRLLIDGFGLLMSSTSSWHLHVVFSCVSLASTIWTTWNVPISPGDIWWVQKNHCNSSGTTTAVLRQGPYPRLLPSVMVQGKNLLEEPVDQASIPSPVQFARVPSSLKCCAFSDCCHCLVSHSQFLSLSSFLKILSLYISYWKAMQYLHF